ncbi:MAG: hypothetical protein ACK5WP_09345 [Neisseriaceae bacterium]
MLKYKLIVMGAGSLARSIVYSLPMLYKDKLDVLIIGRNMDDVTKITTIASTRSIICNSNVRFAGQVMEWDNFEELGNIIANYCPEMVVLAASMQSPWTLNKFSSKWAALISEIGFGFTLPFQANFAIKVSTIIKKLNNRIKFINACYPDEVNQLLKSLDLPITTGVGNISILASYIPLKFNVTKEDLFQMVGHHCHVEPPKGEFNSELQKPRIWINDFEIQYDNSLLNDIRNAVISSESNQITGISAAQVISALFSDTQTLLHVPGPFGLPGGYPVLIRNGNIEVSLPKGLTLKQAINFNTRCSELDGVKFDKSNKRITFNINEYIMAKYGLHSPHFNSFYLNDFDQVIHEFIELRHHLTI